MVSTVVWVKAPVEQVRQSSKNWEQHARMQTTLCPLNRTNIDFDVDVC